MISEGSCSTEDWSNDAERIFLSDEHLLSVWFKKWEQWTTT